MCQWPISLEFSASREISRSFRFGQKSCYLPRKIISKGGKSYVLQNCECHSYYFGASRCPAIAPDGNGGVTTGPNKAHENVIGALLAAAAVAICALIDHFIKEEEDP